MKKPGRVPNECRASRLELEFETQLCAVGVRDYVREYEFARPARKWRFDFAWPDRLLAVECEGATWARGRHTRGSGFEADAVKYGEALVNGWRVLRVTRRMIENGQALAMVERLLKS